MGELDIATSSLQEAASSRKIFSKIKIFDKFKFLGEVLDRIVDELVDKKGDLDDVDLIDIIIAVLEELREEKDVITEVQDYAPEDYEGQ